jgi:ADP-ribose pyrophosphatase YjhB (NUDIX family)
MSDDPMSTAGPRVVAYAVIGHDDKLLLVADDNGYHSLPGGPVEDGEPIEQTLRRSLHDQLGATVAHLDFCTVIEHDTTTLGQGSTSAVAFMFHVTLNDLDHLVDRRPTMHWWADEPDLTSLHPEAIWDGLIAGTLSADNPWQAWTP